MSGRVGDDLQHIPMLGDLAVLGQAEDVDARVIMVAGPVLPTVEDNEVSFGNASYNLNTFSRIFERHPLEIVDETSLACGHRWVVLDVVGTDEPLDRFCPDDTG
jgi:hypothetical protein